MDGLEPAFYPWQVNRFDNINFEEMSYSTYNFHIPSLNTIVQPRNAEQAGNNKNLRLERIKKFLDDSMPAYKYNKSDSRKEDAEDCSICIEEFGIGTEALQVSKEANAGTWIRRLTCKHVFHKECIDEWFEKKIDCPLCRRVILVHEKELIE